MTNDILAIDPASNKTGIAIFSDGELQFTSTFVATADTPLKRRIQTAVYLNQLFDQYGLTVCEEPLLLGRNNNGMQRLLGMIELGDPNVVFIHPMTIKKAMGSGTLDKLSVAIAAGEKLQTEKEKEIIADAVNREAWDETDAVAIGLTYLCQTST
jgi:Holliday junction resolvasome RuvABC endonuclease subunit